ncbi:MAG TPA: lactate utilization protein [Pyrinomonadaceae bacterium]|jgi:L-lactate dehydrogenase complex protein LldG
MSEKLAQREGNKEVRRAMLTAIREHLDASAPFDRVRAEHHSHHGAAEVSRRADVIVSESGATPVERFKEMLEAVGGHVAIVRDEREAGEMLSQIIEQTKARRIALSDSPTVQSLMKYVRADAELLQSASAAALFDCDIGITGAQWAIAETGTLVLAHDEERHRLTSLVPTVHVALVVAEQVLATLGEVLQALDRMGPERLSRTVTFITGPSRTSDIELTLAIGVHGPAELFVIIVEGETL